MPQTLKQARGFTALASYYRKHVENFAKIAKSLHALTKKGKKFVWGPEEQRAFEQLKVCLANAPVMATPTAN